MKRLSFFLIPVVLAGWGAEATSRVFIYQGRIRAVRANPISVDGVEVAKLRHRWSYFVLKVAPGEHAIRGRRNEYELLLRVAAGKDYYLRWDQILNSAAGGDKPTAITCQEARTVIESGKLHPIEPDDVLDQSKVELAMPTPACE